MMVIRPVSLKDLNAFGEFPLQMAVGMNLPKTEEGLKDKIALSEASFQKKVTIPGPELYFFILEDCSNGKIAATCGILAEASSTRSHFFRVKNLETHAQHPAVVSTQKILEVVKEHPKASEVCSLYLHPEYRHLGLGRLVSFSRFLFIAQERKRFESMMMAEMRGFMDENRDSPFWDAVGRRFCHLSYREYLNELDKNKDLIKEILPQFPLYVALLPKEAQEVISQIHPNTAPALEMLKSEGFFYENEIDVGDAGPIVMAHTDKIRTVKQNELMEAEISTDDSEEERSFIISNNRIDFRACYGSVKKKENKVIIQKEVAKALEVENGDLIRFVSTR